MCCCGCGIGVDLKVVVEPHFISHQIVLMNPMFPDLTWIVALLIQINSLCERV